VELLSKHESPERAVIRFQGKTFDALHSPSARPVATECVRLGATYPVLEKSLCLTFARLELLPRRIKIMLEARPDSPHALRELTWMSEVIRLADKNADQTTIVFGIDDPTKPPDEAWSAITLLTHIFAGAPETERLLRARLGLSLLLHQHFRDGAPHDALVARLVWAAISIRVDFTDIQHYRETFVKRQSA
jgi:hypothetical protein